MDRREFLAAAAALSVAPRLAFPATHRLRAAPAIQNLVGEQQPATDVWAYNGTVPGPQLRFRQDDRLRIEVENALDAPTTVHWHGLRVPNAMDGVPHLTQLPIAAGGGRFVYEFQLPDAGTYWYHPHLGSPEQVGRGLYGALVVEERAPPQVDRDVTWMLSDWRLDRSARIAGDFGSFFDASHAGRIGNTVTVNGAIRESFEVRPGERLRLRLVNAAAARIFGLQFAGHAPWVIALDGHPVAPHQPARVVLAPGMRADLVLDCAAPAGSRHRVVDGFYPKRAYELLELRYRDERPLRAEFPPPPALPPNPLAEPDLRGAERHVIRFEGGAMGRLPASPPGMAWTVNGKAVGEHAHHGHEPPLLALRKGRSYLLELANETRWHHPIHLHGHVFRVLTHPLRHWADGVLLDPQARAEIAFVADNPGDWMLHCHVLEHQASGMMGVVRVE